MKSERHDNSQLTFEPSKAEIPDVLTIRSTQLSSSSSCRSLLEVMLAVPLFGILARLNLSIEEAVPALLKSFVDLPLFAYGSVNQNLPLV